MQCFLANAPPVEVPRCAEPMVENFRKLDHRLFMLLVRCASLRSLDLLERQKVPIETCS
jgi:hypothetical protein